MTTPSTARKAGPLLGNGSQTAWPFTFKVFAAGDIKVTIADSAGVETVLVLDTDYSVSLNANQDTSPGGTVTYPISGSPLPVGGKLSITGDIDYDQPLDLPSGGNFSPLALENQLDRATMQIQQLAEQMVRAVKVPVTDDIQSSDLAQGILDLAPVIDDIQTVSGISSDVTAVAGNAANVNTVATNVVDIQNFADVYQGAKVSAPALRNDSSPLQLGDLYFDTTLDAMQAYGSAGWVAAGPATPVTITTQRFSGNGSTTAFTLSAAPPFAAALDVYISGVYQNLTADYTVSGTTLTFTSAPPAGTNNITTKVVSTYAGGVPNNDSVTTDKLADSAVTTAKIAGNAVTLAKLATVSTAQILGRSTAGTGNVESLSAATARSVLGLAAIATSGSGADITTGDIAAARITTALNATGSAPIYACRAWVNFNGTGTVAIRSSGNVTSITDHNVGIYTVNFTTAMPDAQYCVTGTVGRAAVTTISSTLDRNIIVAHELTSAGARIVTVQATGTADTTVAGTDRDQVCVAIFR